MNWPSKKQNFRKIGNDTQQRLDTYSLQGLLLFLNLEPFRDRCNIVSNLCWVSFPILRKFCFLLGQFTSFSKLTKINCPTICLYKLSKWLTDSRIAHEYFRQEIEKKRESKLEWVREDLDMSINKYKSRIKNRFFFFYSSFPSHRMKVLSFGMMFNENIFYWKI